jgi:hypothetical protein
VLLKSEVFELANRKFGAGNWFFMQAGASPHTTKENMNWLYARCKSSSLLASQFNVQKALLQQGNIQ